jgi:hypothetical protein
VLVDFKATIFPLCYHKQFVFIQLFCPKKFYLGFLAVADNFSSTQTRVFCFSQMLQVGFLIDMKMVVAPGIISRIFCNIHQEFSV